MSNLLRGHFLIAGKQLHDPNFLKTVVLMVEHTPQGAMGVVVNRPSTVSVAHALSGHFELPETGELVYFGGPVEPAALLVLHDAGNLQAFEPGEDGLPVLPGLYLGNSPEVFERVVRQSSGNQDGLQYRIYSGCAGWGPQQLEGELARGDWYTMPACRDLVFDDDPYEVWDKAIQCVSEANRIISQPYGDPEWN